MVQILLKTSEGEIMRRLEPEKSVNGPLADGGELIK